MNLFTYGTLMFPEIWKAVVGENSDPRTTPAELAGYDIRKFEGYDFPGIIPDENAPSHVPGLIYHDLNEATLDKLDAYEDAAYFRKEITTVSGTSCQTYVVRSTHYHLLSNQRWTADWFDEHCRTAYFAGIFH